MNWLILTFAMLVLVILSFVLGTKFDSDVLAILAGGIGFTGLFLAVIVFAVGSTVTPKEVNSFLQQQEYIESHQATNPVEDAALTSKKMELNKWLYDAQYSKRRWGGWSFYDDDIFELEPIV